MIEINFLQPEYRKKEARKIKMPPLPTMRYFVFTLVFLGLVELALAGGIYYKNDQISNLQLKYQEMKPYLMDIDKLRRETSRIQKKLRILRGMIERPFYWSEVLDSIANEITDGVWLTGVNMVEEIRREDEGQDNARRKKRRKQNDDELKMTQRLIIRGYSDSNLGGTAAVTKYIQKLEQDEVFGVAFSRIWLEKIGRRVKNDQPLFDFTITCDIAEAEETGRDEE